MNEIYDFLKKAGTYFLATAEGDQPRVRPFGTIDIFEGKLYIQTGLSKDVAKQIDANPFVEICACTGDTWLRISTELVKDDDHDVKVKMLNKMPSLKAMYSADDDSMQMYYMKDAKAVFSSFTAEPETVEF